MSQAAKVSFHSGGADCIGYLHLPPRAGGPTPCVVLCPGFGGTQDTPAIQAVARAFVDAGFAALTFDYRSFGESGGTPRQVVQIAGQHSDIRAAVELARGHPAIDPRRIALWGTSLGGGHVVVVAAADRAIAAVVAQIPFNGFPQQVAGRSAAATRRLLGAMARDLLRGWLGKTPAYIPAVGAPGELAVMASPEAQQAIAGMQSRSWRNEVAPRALFAMMRYKPGAYAARLTVPVLVCVAEHDREAPPELARALGEAAPRGEVLGYPYAHFAFYQPEVRAQVAADQIAFLRRHL
jgi:dienelactone hydrolase